MGRTVSEYLPASPGCTDWPAYYRSDIDFDLRAIWDGFSGLKQKVLWHLLTTTALQPSGSLAFSRPIFSSYIKPLIYAVQVCA